MKSKITYNLKFTDKLELYQILNSFTKSNYRITPLTSKTIISIILCSSFTL